MLHLRRIACLIGLTTLLALGAWSLASSLARADGGPDKSGVKPQVINLPSGPGSVQGLGDAFQPQLNSGTAGYRVSLALPAGSGGFAPSLDLVYDGGQGNGPFGLGWRLDLPVIQRQTDKGLPRYQASDHFIHSGEELAPLADGTYRLRTEAAFSRFRRVGDGWEATTRGGVRWLFGETAAGRVANSLGSFAWLPQREVDTNGNEVRFFYQGNGGQRYLSEIRYNFPRGAGFGAEPPNTYVSVRFEYEARPDALTDYRSRSPVRTAWRTKAVEITSLGQRVRRYEFGYDAADVVSLLTEVRELGADLARWETNPTGALPPLRLSYTRFDPAQARNVSMTNPPVLKVGTPNADLVDINSDSLPDVVETDPYDSHRFFLNRGRGRWASQPTYPSQSPPDVLSTQGVQLADMDGDSRADLLVKPGDTATAPFYFYPNRGGSAWELASRIDFNFNPPFTFEDANVQLVDLDNDKRVDVLRTTDSVYYVYFNQGSTWSGGPDRVLEPLAFGAVLTFDDPRVRLADMNGDRLQDMVFVMDGQAIYFPSRGLGDFAEVVLMSGSPDLYGRERETLLADVNGDGLADLLLVDRFNVRLWLNQAGAGYGSEIVLTQVPEYIAGETTLRLADMNGDCATDLLYSTYPAAAEDTFRYLDFTGGTSPHLLSRIENGLGRTITLSYRTATDYYVDDWDAGQPWTLRSPVPVTVVSRSTVHDANSGQTYVTDYTYRNAYYDAEEKAFRGFAMAQQIDRGDPSAPTQVQRIIFDTGATDRSRKGMILQSDILGEGGTCGADASAAAESAATSAFAATSASPNACYNRSINQLATQTLADSTDGRKVTFSVIAQTDVLDYEATASFRRKQRTFSYDDYGNPIRQFDYGEVAADGTNPGLGRDERLTYTSYAINPGSWIVDRVSEVRQTDLAGNFVSRQRRYYDGPDFVGLPLGQVMKGNLTRQEDSLGPADGNRWVQTARNRNDLYGNMTGRMDPAGALANGQPTGGHWTAATFDPTYHAYPIEEAVQLGGGRTLTLRADYDLALGVITRAVDFNNQELLFRYDPLARLTAIIKPGDAVTLPTLVFGYSLGAAVSAVTTEMRERSGTSEVYRSVSYVDGLGRTLQTRSEGERGKVVIKDAVTFNLRGKEREKYLPYYAATASLAYAAPEANQPKTTLSYDPTLRQVQTTNPDGTVASTQFLPWRQVIADEEQTNPASPHYNKTTEFVFDGLGRQIETLERNGVAVYNTRFAYDLLDNLITITDSQGNVKRQSFDALKRKLTIDDPDRGRTTYTYDDAGNVLEAVDAKGQRTTYTYDGANRVLTENDVKTPGDTTADVRYHYDNDLAPEYSDARNTAGRLAWVEDASGREYLSYDARSNLTGQIKRILLPGETSALDSGASTGTGAELRTTDNSASVFKLEHSALATRAFLPLIIGPGQPSNALDFVTLTRYDAMDRPTEMTYPDGTVLTYQYNDGTLLEAIPGYVNGIDYLASGQRAAMVTADGVRTTYQYDVRQRLTALAATHTATDAVLQDLRYRFDGVNNILGIDDARTGRTPGDDDTRTFAYDDLYRLISVRYAAGSQDNIAYTYDPIGNLVRQTSNVASANLGDLRHGQGAGPHALTEVGGQPWTYDRNGNLTAKPNLTFAWDFRDRLIGVNGLSGLHQDHAFDYAGNRVTKLVRTAAGAQTVLYPNNTVEVRGDQLVKYVFAGDQRVTEVRAPFGRTNLIHGFSGARGSLLEDYQVHPGASPPAYSEVFYHPDHLGSATVLTDRQGAVVERTAYYPYGIERGRAGDAAVNHRFTGKELDVDIGLYYYGARFYDPRVGRFISVDPLGFAESQKGRASSQKLNLYAYGNDSPLIYADPTGQESEARVEQGTRPAKPSGMSESRAVSPASASRSAPHSESSKAVIDAAKLASRVAQIPGTRLEAVQGYVRSNGTKVEPYLRTVPGGKAFEPLSRALSLLRVAWAPVETALADANRTDLTVSQRIGRPAVNLFGTALFAQGASLVAGAATLGIGSAAAMATAPAWVPVAIGAGVTIGVGYGASSLWSWCRNQEPIRGLFDPAAQSR